MPRSGAEPVSLPEAGSIIAPIRLQALAVALVLLLGSVCNGISRRGRPWHGPLLSARSAHTREAEIMLGVLVEILRGNGIAANRGLACEGDVALKNLVGAAADSHVGAIAVECLIARR